MTVHKTTAVYRLYDAEGSLLYVGIAHNPGQRWKQHAQEKPWWHQVARKTVEWHPDRLAAEAAETHAIANEKPAYDQTARRWVHPNNAPPRLVFDTSTEQARVAEAVAQKIQEGIYGPGKLLGAAAIGREYGVSSITAHGALGDVEKNTGLVRHHVHARFRVQAA